VETLYYRESVRFAEQLERYRAVFGPERIHVILYDDFRDATAATYRGVLEFLGVDPEFRPELAVRNPNRRARIGPLQRVIYQPPGPLLRLVPWLRRFSLVHWVRDRLLRLNSSAVRRPPMDPALRRQLLDEQADEIQRLGRLINRDLSGWLEERRDEAA
jgi:hypothetical protein